MTARVSPARRVRVLLADDHVLIRRALRELLESVGWLEIVAEVSDGPTAVAEAQRLCPDAAIVDIALPCLDGVRTAAAIRSLCPKTKVLLLSFDEDPAYVQRAMLAGASGLIGKIGVERMLVPALQRTVAGQPFFTLRPRRRRERVSESPIQPFGYASVPFQGGGRATQPVFASWLNRLWHRLRAFR